VWRAETNVSAIPLSREGGAFPGDETVREYVTGLARGTDEANDYDQAELEHRALRELGDALGPYSCS
jgi:hypothetical protein